MKPLIAILVTLSTFCVINSDAASYCYSCTSCSDPFDFIQNTTCLPGSVKAYIGFPDSVDALMSGANKKLIFRGCVPASTCTSSYSLLVLGTGISIGCCTGNLCNSALSTKITTLSTVGFPILAALYHLCE